MKSLKRGLTLILAGVTLAALCVAGMAALAQTAAEISALPGFVNDNDASISYTGNWGQGDSRDPQASAAGGGRAYTTAENAAATMTFNLTGPGLVKVVMTKQNGSGYVDVSVDGGTATQVNTNSGSDTAWAQIVFTSGELAAGAHTVTVTNADGGWGVGYVYLEGFIVEETGAPPTPFPAGDDLSIDDIEGSPYFVDDNDPAVIYSGGWGKDPDGAALNEEYAGGQRAYSGSKNASAELFFKGDSLKLIMSVATAEGSADLYIDGEFKRVINTKASSMEDFSYNAVVYSTDALDPDAVHSVKLVNTDNNSWIYLIGFMVKEKLSSPAKYAIERDPGFINDDDEAIAYTGAWGQGASRDAQENAAGGGRAYTTEENAKAACTFTGNEIKVIMTRQNGSGFVDIAIDGGEPTRVNTGAESTQWAQVVFEKKNLADGEHTITVTNAKDDGNLGYVYLEGFIASERSGPPMLDPREVEKAPGFINDTDSHIVYKGNWGRGEQEENGRYVHEDFAGGGCAYLSPDGLQPKTGGALLTFEGTEIAVLMERKSGNGYVSILLDGREMINPDDPTGLWNTNTLEERDPNAVIFKKSGLDQGKHTIEIYSVDGGYGYGWIYLAGFLTDGRAVPYEEITTGNPDETGNTGNTPDTTKPGTENPDDNPTTGTVPATGVFLLAAVAGLVVLTGIRRRGKAC